VALGLWRHALAAKPGKELVGILALAAAMKSYARPKRKGATDAM
jgi:hypothetical protein